MRNWYRERHIKIDRVIPLNINIPFFLELFFIALHMYCNCEFIHSSTYPVSFLYFFLEKLIFKNLYHATIWAPTKRILWQSQSPKFDIKVPIPMPLPQKGTSNYNDENSNDIKISNCGETQNCHILNQRIFSWDIFVIEKRSKLKKNKHHKQNTY